MVVSPKVRVWLAVLACVGAVSVLLDSESERFETTDPATPAWAVPKPERVMRGGWGAWDDVVARNASRLRAAEAAGPVDFVLYGDSITAFLNGYTLKDDNPGSEKVWTAAFKGLNAVALGAAGDQIDTVLWRALNAERPARDPGVIGLHVGINDLIGWGRGGKAPEPSTLKRLEETVRLLVRSFPASYVLLIALTPINGAALRKKKAEFNAAAKALTARLQGAGLPVAMVDAASLAGLVDSRTGGPASAKAVGFKVLGDEVHLTGEAHAAHLRQVRLAVDALLAA